MLNVNNDAADIIDIIIKDVAYKYLNVEQTDNQKDNIVYCIIY